MATQNWKKRKTGKDRIFRKILICAKMGKMEPKLHKNGVN